MSDYNFFLEYRVKKTISNPIVMIALIFMLTVITGIIGIIALNIYQLDSVSNNLSNIEMEIAEIKLNDDIVRITSKKELMEKLDQIVLQVDGAKEELIGSYFIDENLFLIITDALPVDIELNNITVDNLQVSLSGTAIGRATIAEYQNNLIESDTIIDVFINSITGSEDNYSFDASLSIEGGEINED